MSVLSRTIAVSSNQLLRRLIEDPSSAEIIRSLAPEPLARLIDHVGLEDAGEIVACASTEQLLGVFDTDLWRREQGGRDGEFQPERFLLWLEILSEAGERALASRLADLSEDLVISAFFAHMLVLNLDDLANQQLAWRSDDVDLADKALMDCLSHELDEYCLVARKVDGWDTILQAVLALYELEPDLLNRILSRCCYASSEYIEENGGLYDVLSAEEMLLSDAAADRDDRRARRGFVAPSDATALFKLALADEPDALLNAAREDPITRSYFRNFERTAAGARSRPAGSHGARGVDAVPEDKRSPSSLPQWLAGAGVLEETPAPPLLFASEDASRKTGQYRAVVQSLMESDPDGHERRVEALVYLANAVEARFGTSDAPVRPVEALRVVFEVIDVGLSYLEQTMGNAKSADSRLRDLSPVSLFLTGIRILSETGEMRSLDAVTAMAEAYLRHPVPEPV